MDDAVRELIEVRAIEQLMVRYLDRIDANDPVGSAACFAPDGIGVYWGEYRGREAIAARLAGILDGFFCTSHHISNIAVTFGPDGPSGDTATSMAYVYAFHRLRPDAEQMHYIGRWVDELVKIEGAWLFARREVVGVGSWKPGDPDQSRHDRFPGHPGRLIR